MPTPIVSSRTCPRLALPTPPPPDAQDGSLATGHLSLLALSNPFLGCSWKDHTFPGKVREGFPKEGTLSCIFFCFLIY